MSRRPTTISTPAEFLPLGSSKHRGRWLREVALRIVPITAGRRVLELVPGRARLRHSTQDTRPDDNRAVPERGHERRRREDEPETPQESSIRLSGRKLKLARVATRAPASSHNQHGVHRGWTVSRSNAAARACIRYVPARGVVEAGDYDALVLECTNCDSPLAIREDSYDLLRAKWEAADKMDLPVVTGQETTCYAARASFVPATPAYCPICGEKVGETGGLN